MMEICLLDDQPAMTHQRWLVTFFGNKSHQVQPLQPTYQKSSDISTLAVPPKIEACNLYNYFSMISLFPIFFWWLQKIAMSQNLGTYQVHDQS